MNCADEDRYWGESPAICECCGEREAERDERLCARCGDAEREPLRCPECGGAKRDEMRRCERCEEETND